MTRSRVTKLILLFICAGLLAVLSVAAFYFIGTGDVPRIYIFTDGLVCNTMGRETVDCRVLFISSDGSSIRDDNARINVRGNSTANGLKKPYKIKFSEKYDLLGDGAARSWIFLAEYYDPTLMKNYLTLNLARDIGLEFTPACEYAELWIDFRYRGCYLITEKIDSASDDLGLNYDAGDFLIQLEPDRTDAGDEDIFYFTLDNGWRFEIVKPDTPDYEQRKRIIATMQNISDALYSGDFGKVESFIDIDSFSKVYLINEYTENLDFAKHSVNMYFKDGILYAGPIWDYDLAQLRGESDGLVCDTHIMNALLKYEEFRNYVYDCLNENEQLFVNIWEQGIDDTFAAYGNVFNRNYRARLLLGAGFSPVIDYTAVGYPESTVDSESASDGIPDNSYEAKLAFLKRQFEERYCWMTEAEPWG